MRCSGRELLLPAPSVISGQWNRTGTGTAVELAGNSEGLGSTGKWASGQHRDMHGSGVTAEHWWGSEILNQTQSWLRCYAWHKTQPSSLQYSCLGLTQSRADQRHCSPNRSAGGKSWREMGIGLVGERAELRPAGAESRSLLHPPEFCSPFPSYSCALCTQTAPVRHGGSSPSPFSV